MAPDEESAGSVVEDVFVSNRQPGDRLEDPPDDVGLGLLANAERRCLRIALPAEPRSQPHG